ncbi:MAG: hypothetical protein AAFQ79_03040 [Pseudomonadota bacterium]
MSATPLIRRWAVVLNILSILAIVVVLVAVAAGILFGDIPNDIRMAAGLAAGDVVPGARVGFIAVIGALPAAAVIYVLVQMGRLFRSYAVGETLTRRCARAITRIGAGLLFMAAMGAVVRPLQILLASLDNPPGERVLAIGFGTMDLGLVLAGGLLLTIGWAMSDAVAAARENAEFV